MNQSVSGHRPNYSFESSRVTNQYALHQAVFNNDVRLATQLLQLPSYDVNKQDIHGNTPLHLAVMLGRIEICHALLRRGALVKLKNSGGWTPLAEAISYGDREIILSLLRALKDQTRSSLEERRPYLIKTLENIKDFSVSLKWEFHSWVPLVSKILPSDICRFRKRGSSLRLDTTLVDFNEMKWVRGDLSFLFDGRQDPRNSLHVLDNKLKVYQCVRYEESMAEMEDEVDLLMSNDIVSASLRTHDVSFTRMQTGWFFREDKTENVGEFSAEFFTAHGVYLDSRKRREHLSPEDIAKNKEILRNLTRGTVLDNIETPSRESLSPPTLPAVSWTEYINAPAGQPPVIGRPVLLKQNCKHFKANVAMSADFPMKLDDLLAVWEVIAPFKHFNKLRDFMLTRLPPGFPVRLEIPVFPTITARVTFFDFSLVPPGQPLDESLFQIPNHFTEDPNRFPDL